MFLEFLQVFLPIVIYILVIVLLIIGIVLGFKALNILNKVEEVVDDVTERVNSISKVFGLFDMFSDKIVDFSDAVVSKVTTFITSKFKKKDVDEED